MAFIARTYFCDSGGDDPEGHKFEVVIERDQHPKFCPRCGSPVEGEPVPSKMSIGGSAAARSVDQTYKLIEESSQERAYLAQEAGATPEQARALKVTDMHDNLREGDVAAKIPQYPNNPVGNFMRQASQVGLNYGWQAGATPGGGVYNGPMDAVSGKRVSGPVNDAIGAAQGAGGTQHQQTRQLMTQRGEQGAAIGNKQVR